MIDDKDLIIELENISVVYGTLLQQRQYNYENDNSDSWVFEKIRTTEKLIEAYEWILGIGIHPPHIEIDLK